MNTPKEILTQWIQHLNEKNLESLMSLYHADAVNIQVATGHPLNGRSAIKRDYGSFFEVSPDSMFSIENLFEDANWGIIEWRAKGTFRPTGKSYNLNGSGFFQIENQKIVFQRGYWDKHTWFSQIEIPLDEKIFS